MLERRLHGKIDRIGSNSSSLNFSDANGDRHGSIAISAIDPASAATCLIDWLETKGVLQQIAAVGHRLVHGWSRMEPEIVTQALIDDLHSLEAIDPDHLPREIELIEAVRRRAPGLPQVACFDTEFHRRMPRVARMMAIPRRFDEKGVQRYGFHGLSYAYLMEELARSAGPSVAQGRVILAHLGNGAKLAAVLVDRV